MDKVKLYFTEDLIEKIGGIDAIERFFDYQVEVVVIPKKLKEEKNDS